MFPQSLLSQGWQLGLASLLALAGAIGGASNCALAQITPDNTLGSENSTVTSTGAIDQINGGATRGTNLFHSFQEFNVGEGRGAFFTNPAGIENILSRVTGANPSNILGRLGVLGTANLFLINPNGIIFGPNASLNIGGSFVGSTASSLNFADGTQFSATAPQNTPLLTVSVPIGLQYGGTAGSILNQSRATNRSGEPVGLQVLPGKTLTLVGGDVRLDGGRLRAPDGLVELVGVAGAGTVGLNVDGNNLSLSYPEVGQRADVSLTNGAAVDVSYQGGGGDIQVQGRRVTLTDGSQIGSGAFQEGSGGTLTVRASESVQLSGTSADGQNPSGLFTQTVGAGAAGDLTIETGRLIVSDGAQVSASTVSGGQGGTLVVRASESVELIGTSTVNPNLSSGLFAVTQGGSGKSGELRIETGQLIVRDGAQVSASSVDAGQRGGTLAVTASESVQLIGTSANSPARSGLLVGTAGIGDAGDLRIETGKLLVQDGALVSARTSQGSTGKGGSIIINTGELNVLNEAEVTVSSLGSGDAGNLQVQARSISLDDQGKLIAETKSGSGGDITLEVQDLLLLRHNSQISTTAGTEGAGGDGGNITINNTPFIVAVPSENSDIKANAFLGQGGEVTITAQSIFGLAERNLKDLQTLLGTNDPIQLDPINLPSSDITAISQTDPSLSGQVTINTPDVDPSHGLVELPAELVDASNSFATGCPDAVARGESKFIITGRGGLPPNPNEPLRGDNVLTNWSTLDSDVENRSNAAPATNPTIESAPTTIVEANGWVISDNGEVVLIAQAPTANLNIPWLPSSDCRAPSGSE